MAKLKGREVLNILSLLTLVADWWQDRKRKKAEREVMRVIQAVPEAPPEPVEVPESEQMRLHLELHQYQHFSPDEFDLTGYGGENWWPRMYVAVVDSLDLLRERWGASITISPVRGALGRRLGPDARSDHNFDRWGEVRCADVFPEGVNAPWDAERFIVMAQAAGFNSIGVYPHWRNGKGEQQCGFHLGIRPEGVDMASWGMVREHLQAPQRTVSMQYAVNVVGVAIPQQ